MNINNVSLEAVCGRADQFPDETLPEIAFAGRSNVGKSSLLNMLTGRKSLAKTSSKPGKTRTINFYNVDNTFRIVDLPGYGFAKAAKSEIEKWARLIETYIEKRQNLIAVTSLIDIRHDPTDLDRQLCLYLREMDLLKTVVLTKADKIPKSQINKKLGIVKNILSREYAMDGVKLIPVSVLKRQGKEELMKELMKIAETGKIRREIL